MDEGLRVDSKWECELLCFGFLRPTVPISMNKLLSLSLFFLFFRQYTLHNRDCVFTFKRFSRPKTLPRKSSKKGFRLLT